MRPNPQAFTVLAPVTEITFPDTLDTMFDPVYEIGIGLDELCACSVWREVRKQCSPSEYIFTLTFEARAGPLQVTAKISITVAATALHWIEVGHFQHRNTPLNS